MTLNARLFGRTQINWLVFAAAFVALSACITVNVNFPESAVQRAADDFVRDLYKDSSAQSSDAEEPTSPVKTKKKKAPASNAKPSVSSSILKFFDFLPTAHAQELNMSSPKSKEIRARMGSRVGEIVKFKQKGALGENFEGELTLKDASGLSADEKKIAEKLVKEENKDRNDLYEEIQSVNSISDRKQTRIRKFFGNAFRMNSPAGTWIEAEEGKWKKK